ncbi:ATP-binding cassette domain-containing protein [Mycetocola tolaasinivorans]|uniref:ATP-binding cassette domain-containing protein n=1 Tax=Mycetocola tolaasinivorans TaxID=76635 RepID=A0A3L7A357_9MICO|nr:ATP-binding cassette domain-containing protein [Mycetocola tolaasinivorans]RLP74524.1 ATP-binding cassette domain-containing protein [Mycetocola tolaasinivorans]
MPLIMTDVDYAFPSARAPLFSQLSLTFQEGALTAVSGPSGSGKSTLLDLLGGLREPTSGHIYSEIRGVRGPVTAASWIVQHNPVLLGRTAAENVALSLLSAGSTHRDARRNAVKMLGEMGLEDRVDEPVSRLSGGEIQRVCIARCLLGPSSVILADEPTGQLDRENSTLIYHALKRAAFMGRIVVIATHDAILMQDCDRNIVLDKGKRDISASI